MFLFSNIKIWIYISNCSGRNLCWFFAHVCTLINIHKFIFEYAHVNLCSVTCIHLCTSVFALSVVLFVDLLYKQVYSGQRIGQFVDLQNAETAGYYATCCKLSSVAYNVCVCRHLLLLIVRYNQTPLMWTQKAWPGLNYMSLDLDSTDFLVRMDAFDIPLAPN